MQPQYYDGFCSHCPVDAGITLSIVTISRRTNHKMVGPDATPALRWILQPVSGRCQDHAITGKHKPPYQPLNLVEQMQPQYYAGFCNHYLVIVETTPSLVNISGRTNHKLVGTNATPVLRWILQSLFGPCRDHAITCQRRPPYQPQNDWNRCSPSNTLVLQPVLSRCRGSRRHQ